MRDSSASKGEAFPLKEINAKLSIVSEAPRRASAPTTYHDMNGGYSCTVGMDTSEEELTRLHEENSRLHEENLGLQNQLELLRGVNREFQYVANNQEYADSIAQGDLKSSVVSNSKTSSTFPDSQSNTTSTECTGAANTVPDSVIKQNYADVEEAATPVDMKMRAQLEAETKKLRAELQQCKRIAKYEIDDVKRVNKSLRADLEETYQQKINLEEELEMKHGALDAQTKDIERIAETFATQEEELRCLKTWTKQLLAENKELKSLALETKVEEKSNKRLSSEIGKLWEEIGRLKETQGEASVSSGRSHNQSV